MIKYFPILFFVFLIGCASTTELQNQKTRITELENTIENLSNEIDLLKKKGQDYYNKSEINQLIATERMKDGETKFDDTITDVTKTTNTTKTNAYPEMRCIAITKQGTQCKRNAEVGSNYCWQHKPKESNEDPKFENNSSSGTYKGNTIITGPRGGQYYINKNGNKTYIKKRK